MKRIRDNEFRGEHPHLSEWKEVRLRPRYEGMKTYTEQVKLGRQFAHPYHFHPSDAPRAMEPVPQGTVRAQILRSAADWSHGILLEDSIQRKPPYP